MAVIAGSFFAACQAAPRQRPVEMGPVDKGPGSLGAVRKQLEGTWTLVSLETYPERGPAVLVKATGQLIYDQYGNLTIKGIVEGSGGGSTPDASRYLILKGRAVIDPTTQRLWVVEGEGDLSGLPPPVSADKVRYYEFSGDVLRMSVKDASGRVTAKVTWKRSQ
jgi:hypothetical protein